ncbi:MAG: LysM peptidoglycan-binding domain-containing protein [Candidatus Saccharibacteria bacterium]|nr:LysM peptidoglycan-binding domain-containing protein [Candidatus Saccharibacteria bacterium]
MKKKIDFDKLKTISLYVLAGCAILALVFVGTLDKKDSDTTLSISPNSSDFQVSTDQVSEMYVVADLSSALNLASAESAAYNYVTTKSMYDSGQASTGKIDKTPVIDVGHSGHVTPYIVEAGDTMDSIAQKYGLTTDQIRWSNGLKNKNISVGDTLYLVTGGFAGIVYKVKSGDTFETIASKYGSTAEEIKIYNQLDDGLKEGELIAIKNGTLPEKERPEYVAPVYTYSYTTYGSVGSRQNMTIVMDSFGAYGGYGWGQCTSWAWYNRQDLPRNLGNAYSWAANAANQGFPVDHNPRPGDVFQHGGGWYGHVGYVESVNQDGSIVVTEANYAYHVGRITRATVDAGTARTFNFIHRK